LFFAKNAKLGAKNAKEFFNNNGGNKLSALSSSFFFGGQVREIF